MQQLSQCVFHMCWVFDLYEHMSHLSVLLQCEARQDWKHWYSNNTSTFIIHFKFDDDGSWKWVKKPLKYSKLVATAKVQFKESYFWMIFEWAHALEYLLLWIDNGKLYFYIQSTTMAEEGDWDV